MASFGKPSVTLLEGRSPVRLVPRASCTNDSDPGCTKPTTTPTLAIALAVAVPVVIAAAVLFYLHRRHVRKLKQEDKDDKYKSLDFGMDGAGPRNKKGKPEMILTDAEKSIRGHRGASLDMNTIASPYIMPAGLHGSRESFHSMSRSAHDPHDPYGPVAFLKDTESIRSGRTGAFRNDNASVYTGSSGGSGRNRMGDGLLKNAQRMSQSFPPRGESRSPQDLGKEIQIPQPAALPNSNLGRPIDGPLPPPPPPPVPIQPDSGYAPFKPMSPPSPPTPLQPSLPAVQVLKSTTPPPRIQSQEAFVGNQNTQSFMSDSSYGEGLKVTPPSPPRQQNRARSESGPVPFAPEPVRPQQGLGLGVEDFNQNTNRLSMSIRPLPSQGDDPNEDPEQRANRIRSFYKEYFDDSKPEPVGQPTYDAYYEDYGSEYLDGAVFDPQTGNFVVARPTAPYAEPVTRRAMTPPPRAPPRFRSGTLTGPGPRGPMSGRSSASSSRFMPPPRGMSSMSGRIPAPRKAMPPPSVLNSLPTPAMLKEDSMMINPIDFAPPVSYRERQNGIRPDSPLGAPRPYSPAVRPHTPLISPFEELPVMPSPHLLRKSGTFTALDFAPPPRFRDPGSNASDAGSIRSNRSGISTTGRMAIRNGAYRVSKIPKEMVGTRDDITTSLRPQMSLVAPA
ncbi:hypothetical protein P154DRAFT_430377 [Amniculicola lignicola CBS 123094]|uniref:Uncharacterized protein n=1 Tax=Amniculicola lignicola CBS 123094 TaxID=1392246 RepID=A0A6A5WPM6_9PLEO|nr:hypothetical protein P154DRAFT_430377 [Amniculicola lignicola CBS 123094]